MRAYVHVIIRPGISKVIFFTDLHNFMSIISIILIVIINFLLGFRTSDPMSGFFIFKKKVYLKNKKFLFNNGYKILLDLIYSSKEKIKISDVDINFRSRSEGSSKINFKIIYFLGLIIFQKFYLRISNIFN